MAKKSKIEKNFWHIDNRKEDKVTRKDFKEYVEWFHQQKFKCLECRSGIIELHHVKSQDNRTAIPFCSMCHRGDERLNREILSETSKNKDIVAKFKKLRLDTHPRNTSGFVTEGYYLHRGTRSKEFRQKWTDEKLLGIASELYEKYLKEKK